MPPLYFKYKTWKPGPVRLSELYPQCVSRRHDTAAKTGISKLTVQPVKRQLCWVNLCEGGDLDCHTSLFYSSFGIGGGSTGFHFRQWQCGRHVFQAEEPCSPPCSSIFFCRMSCRSLFGLRISSHDSSV